MRVTKDALAVDTPIWVLGDSAYDILGWHDFMLAQGVVLIAPYNPRNTDEPLTIEYRVEDHIGEHAEDISHRQQCSSRRTIIGRNWSEQTKPARTAASGADVSEAASMHEHKCSWHCLSVWSSSSATMNEDTIPDE